MLMQPDSRFCRERHWCCAHAWPRRHFIISRSSSVARHFHVPVCLCSDLSWRLHPQLGVCSTVFVSLSRWLHRTEMPLDSVFDWSEAWRYCREPWWRDTWWQQWCRVVQSEAATMSLSQRRSLCAQPMQVSARIRWSQMQIRSAQSFDLSVSK